MMMKGVRKTVLLLCLVLLSALIAGAFTYAEDSDVLTAAADEVSYDDSYDDGSADETAEEDFYVEAADDEESEQTPVTTSATPAITVKAVKADSEYLIKLTGVTASYKSVLFPTWSDFNGQDDLVWNKAVKQTDGSYTYTLKISNYKHIGLFKVHSYGVDSSNNKTFIKGTTFETTYPKGGTAGISKSNYNKGTFTVSAASIKNASSAKSIRASIWSKSDKSDAKTLTLTKQSDGSYAVDVSLSSFGYNPGVYQARVFTTDKLGDQRDVGTTSVNMKATYTVSIKSGGKSSVYAAWITNFKYPGGIKKMYFPTWSVLKGQDDLKWYVPTKQSATTYKALIDLANHKHLGQYTANLYVADANGKLHNLKTVTYAFLKPEGGTVKVSSVNKTAGTFKITVSGIKYVALAKSIRIPVWSKADQSDIKWYTATKQNNGSYTVTANIKNHKYNAGTYSIHAYAIDSKGDLRYLNKSTCAMTGSASTPKVAGVSGKPSYRTVTVSNVVVPGGVKSVHTAVWSVNDGQDDLKWYAASLKSGSYTATFDLTGHHSSGTFNVHVYGKTNGGCLCKLCTTTFSVTGSASGTVKASSANGKTGMFAIAGSSLSSARTIKAVYFDVYTKSDKSDRYRYTGALSGGVYSTTANVKNHKYNFGTYTVEMLAQLDNGACVTAGKTTCKLTADRYVYVTRLSDAQVRVTLYDPKYASMAAVEFPTWSNTGGQDDIIWYAGTNVGGGKWTVTVSGINHLHAGLFNTHVYAKDSSGNRTGLNTTTYTLAFSTGFTGRRRGVDVSHWNGTIDWNKVKAAGIKYAIIRCGYGKNSTAQDDRQWAANVAACEKIGMPYGVYIYSHATTEAQALDEAKHCIRLLKGHYPKYPVYLDLEDPTDTAPLSNAMLAKITKKFCDTIKANGYKPGVYSSTSWWETKLTSSVFNNYSKWVAQWASRCYYTGTYDMWQYTSTGKVNGITGDVDLNYAY